MAKLSSIPDCRYHGKTMAFGDYCHGRNKMYHDSPWRGDAKRTAAYNEGYEAEWKKMVDQNGEPKPQDNRREALWD